MPSGLPHPMPPCRGCGAAAAADQRYCLHCGARLGAPRVDGLAALGLGSLDGARASEDPRAWGAAGEARGWRAAGAPRASASAGGRAPSRRLGAALAAAALGVGVALGASVSPAPPVSLAAAPQRIIALLPPAAAPQVLPAATPPAAPSADAAPAPAPTPTPTAAQDTAPVQDTAPAADTTGTPAPTAAPAPAPAPTPTPTPARHVWVVALTERDLAPAVQPGSTAPFLAQVATKGTFLSQYSPLPGGAVPNGLALLAGLSPEETAARGCTPDQPPCTVPDATPTIGTQLAAAGRTWRAYVETAPSRDPLPAGAAVGLDRLDADLADAAATPAFSLVVPGPCHDGREAPCADGAPAGLAAADAFLRDVVGRITASAAYHDGGVVVIAPDAPPDQNAAPTDQASSPPAQTAAPAAPTGALVLTPSVTTAVTVATPAGPAALLRAAEDALGLPPLGHAAEAAPAFTT